MPPSRKTTASAGVSPRAKRAPATTPEGRENQLISAAIDLAERQKIYSQLSDWLANTATQIPIFHKVQPYVWTPDLNIPVNYPNYPQICEWSWAK